MATTNAESAANMPSQTVPSQHQNNTTPSTLIDEKKARKRHLDRIAQRRKRQKDRETMERLKRSLEQPHDPTLLHTLAMKQEQDLARIYRHRERVMQIQSLIQADLADLDDEQTWGQHNHQSPPSDDSHDAHQTGFKTAPSQTSLKLGPDISNSSPTLLPQLDLDGFSWDGIEASNPEQRMPQSCVTGDPNNYIDVLPLLTNENSSDDHGLLGSSYEYMEPLNVMQSTNKSMRHGVDRADLPITDNEHSCVKCESVWKSANLNIGLAQHQYRTSMESQPVKDNEPDTDAHMIITAIAEGWSVAEQSPFWNEQWSILREIDQTCHGASGSIERLVILFNVRRMIKVRES